MNQGKVLRSCGGIECETKEDTERRVVNTRNSVSLPKP